MKSLYVIAAATLLSSSALAQSTDQISAMTLQPGMVQIARMPAAFGNVIVGDSEIADVTTMTERRIAITAKKEGFASIVFLGEDQAFVGLVNVAVVPSEQFGRSQIRVTRNATQVQTLHCDGNGAGPCLGEPPPVVPIISTGPIITGDAIRAAREPARKAAPTATRVQ